MGEAVTNYDQRYKEWILHFGMSWWISGCMGLRVESTLNREFNHSISLLQTLEIVLSMWSKDQGIDAV